MRTLVLITALAISTPAMAFEGEVQLRGTGAASAGLERMIVLVAKNGDVSMEITTQTRDGVSRTVGYLKPSKGRYNYMLDHKRKLVLQVPKDTFHGVPDDSKPDKKLDKESFAVETLGHETVAGHRTRHLRIIDKDTGDISELWLSDKYSVELWSQVMGFGADGTDDQLQDWNEAAANFGFKPGFPMKVVNKDRQGAQSGIEVVKISAMKVDSKSFSLPADYQLQEMHAPTGGAVR